MERDPVRAYRRRRGRREASGRGRLSGLPGAVLADERLGGQLHCAGSVVTGWRAERIRFAGLLHVAPIDTCPFTEIPPVAGGRGMVRAGLWAETDIVSA
jgi:hypothetical protein